MFKAYKYRIYPTKEQIVQIENTFGCCRLVYNLALETKITSYKSGVKLTEFDLCYQLKDLKKDYKWLADVDSQSLLASIKKMDVAYRRFFKGAGYPNFKKKSGKQSFHSPLNTRKIDWENKTLTIPKIKNIPIVLSRKFDGKIKTVTISKTPTGKYFASIVVEENLELPAKNTIDAETAIGIDLGLKHFAIFDSGEVVENPQFLRADLARLKVLQRRAAKKKKGSANKKKANLRVAILHEKIENKRTNFLHTLSHKIVNDNQVNTICMEDLAVSNMVKNHKLAMSISDVSWGKFIRLVEYKCNWAGKNFIQIDRFSPSSKTCSCCGNTNKELSLKDREWSCEGCGIIHDRDINAAINIKQMGLKHSGWRSSGEPVELSTMVEAKKQEMQIMQS